MAILIRGAATGARDPRQGRPDEQWREKGWFAPNTGNRSLRRSGSRISGKYMLGGGRRGAQLPRAVFLANINETDHGHDIKMSVRPDGSFAMTNETHRRLRKNIRCALAFDQ